MTIIPYSINRRDIWDEFVRKSKNGTFLLERSFMDYHADRFFDCSLMVYSGISPDDEYKETQLGLKDLIAVFPANWVEKERTVYSHQGLTYGGLIMRDDITQVEVLQAMQAVFMYYLNYMQATTLIYKAIPYIYSIYPSQEDLYALFRAGARVDRRVVSTVVDRDNMLNNYIMRQRGYKKAIDKGFYLDRMSDGDWDCLKEYWDMMNAEIEARDGEKPIHSFDEMKLLMERFPKNIKLNIVRNTSDVIVAGIIVFLTQKVVHLQYISANEEGRVNGALDMLSRNILSERYKPMKYVDLGNSNEKDGRFLDEITITKKESFGGRGVCYDTFRIHLDSDRLETMWGHWNVQETRPIDFLNLKKINSSFEPVLSQEISRTVSSGWYLLGSENKKFEESFANFCGTRHCVLTANGLEALTLILMAYKKLGGWNDGDRVIVPANTYIATILAIINTGLKPILVEPDIKTCLMNCSEESIQKFDAIAETEDSALRAIMPVHLYGRALDVRRVKEWAHRRGIVIIEDAAQAHGAEIAGTRVGNLGDAAGFSFYPGKNLGALGDAGCVTTNDEELALCVREMANYGCSQKYVNKHIGINSRTDEIQATVLSVKLPRLEEDNDRRRQIAQRYIQGITNPLITLPQMPKNPLEHVWHIFMVRCPEREKLQKYLANKKIQTLIHYPIPPHRQEALQELLHKNPEMMPETGLLITERISRECLSLPISPVLTNDEADRVIKALNEFLPE